MTAICWRGGCVFRPAADVEVLLPHFIPYVHVLSQSSSRARISGAKTGTCEISIAPRLVGIRIMVLLVLTNISIYVTIGAMIRIWRLSEFGKDNLGLACNADGLFLGRTPLLERCGDQFVVREKDEIERLLGCAYHGDIAADRIISGLSIVASALTAKDICLAAIAAVHLRLPDLPNPLARADMERVDAVIKLDKHDLAAGSNGGESVAKASPDDPKHPGWPAGTPGGVGGEFRPKDGAAPAVITREIRDRISRRAMRINLTAALHVGIEGLANLTPAIDVAADVMMLADIARFATEYQELSTDAAAAFAFVKNAPYSLEDMQAAKEYREFSNYDAFLKGAPEVKIIEKFFGRAGDGSQYHHIVTQGGVNDRNLLSTQLQNTDNVIVLPTLLHEMVSDEYKGPAPDRSNRTLYQWLQTQPYEVQREYGLSILRKLRILK